MLARLHPIVFALLVLTSPFVAVFGMLAGLAWLEWEDHEFGPWDPRVLPFVSGRTVAEMGLVDAVPGTLRYRSKGSDSPALGVTFIIYRTRSTQDAVIAAYEKRCAALGLSVQRGDAPLPPGEQAIGCARGDHVIGVHLEGDSVTLHEERE